MGDRCNFPQLLARQGLRATALRLLVLEILGNSARTWTVRDLLTAVRRQRPANKVTIYRILEDFMRLGLVRRLSGAGGAAHYELACEHHPPHPHFHCRDCGEVQCLEPVPLERLWRELKGPLGNQAERLEIRVAGVCHKCRKIS
jgi:Fur family ferric uptake transcriptional regulator|uniref:Transcriptional repressor n=1 Tax=Desulfobacca acetoxidans TaxID=60893 RepID=A0A7C5AM10_9BACT